MRGTVLLMLYLAIDQWDLRPLIVDQPEENLDPQSVYDELVGYFRAAKHRRQVILVTHNPNLVVNADADQVIVAEAERKGHPGFLKSGTKAADSKTMRRGQPYAVFLKTANAPSVSGNVGTISRVISERRDNRTLCYRQSDRDSFFRLTNRR